MIAVKKQIRILQKNILLLYCIMKNAFENKIIVITARSPFILAISCYSGNNNIHYKNNPIIRDQFQELLLHNVLLGLV